MSWLKENKLDKKARNEHKLFLLMRKDLRKNGKYKPKNPKKVDGIIEKLDYANRAEMLDYATAAEKLIGILRTHVERGRSPDNVDNIGRYLQQHRISAQLESYKIYCFAYGETEYFIEFELRGAIKIDGKEYKFTLGKDEEDVSISGAEKLRNWDELITKLVDYAEYCRGILAAFGVKDLKKLKDVSERELVLNGIFGIMLRRMDKTFRQFLSEGLEKAEEAADNAQAHWNSLEE